MLSVEECMEILDIETLCFEEYMILHCNMNTLEIPHLNISLTLNESQKRLLTCLIKKINAKRELINIIWYENHQRISDNNYHQLAFQMRALFQRHGLPANLVVTVPYYGMKLNETLCRSVIPTEKKEPAEKNEDVTPVSKAESGKENKISTKDKNPVIFMLSFFMLSLAVYWLK